MKEVCVGPVSQVPLGQAKVFLVANQKIAVFHQPDGFYALDDHCPHRSGPLSEGWVTNYKVSCPWHQWEFNLKNGECETIPGTRVACFEVEVRGGDLWIKSLS
jgi:nitrite reductase (NADH) small subunit